MPLAWIDSTRCTAKRIFFFAMRPTLFRRLVAGLAALAFMVTLGLQGMHIAAMASTKGDMAMSMTSPSGAHAGTCADCRDPGKRTVMQCDPICTPSAAVLPVAEPISHHSQPALFDAENLTFDGRTGTPEPHPPKPAVLI